MRPAPRWALRVALALVPLAACVAADASAPAGEPAMKIDDPAVPTCRPLPAPPAVRARRHPRGTVLARPRPLADGAVTSDWPNFLGPTHNAVSPETKLLKDFTSAPGEEARPRLLWQVTKGPGYAAPSVAGERVVLFHRVGNEEVVECLHAERGDLYWQHGYPTTYRDRFGYNGGPRATPAIAAGRVFTYGAQGKLHCLDLRTGHLYWKRDVAREFDIRASFFGAGCSPLVADGLVVLNIGARRGPSVVAFDAKTGRLAWGAERTWGAGYASCVPATIHGRRVVFVFAGGWSDPPTGGLICLDPRTGRTHFRFPFRSERVASVNASSPVVVGDLVFVSSIYAFGGALLRVGRDLRHTVAYHTRDYASHWMTPIARDGYLYGFSDAEVVCMDVKTGKEVWRHRPPQELPPGARVKRPAGPARLGRASMIGADGAFLCLGEYGDLCWLDLSTDGMKITARAKLFHARQTWTCPVLSRGLLYVCQNEPDRAARKVTRVLCYDLRGGALPEEGGGRSARR